MSVHTIQGNYSTNEIYKILKNNLNHPFISKIILNNINKANHLNDDKLVEDKNIVVDDNNEIEIYGKFIQMSIITIGNNQIKIKNIINPYYVGIWFLIVLICLLFAKPYAVYVIFIPLITLFGMQKKVKDSVLAILNAPLSFDTIYKYLGFLVSIIILLSLTLPFHYIIKPLNVFPKKYLTFQHTFIDQEDINKLITKYNSSTGIERILLDNDAFHRTLLEEGVISISQRK